MNSEADYPWFRSVHWAGVASGFGVWLFLVMSPKVNYSGLQLFSQLYNYLDKTEWLERYACS